MIEYLRVGFIARPHGLKGAVKLDPLTDDVTRFKGMKEGYLELHGSYAPVRLSVLSFRPDAVVVVLEGYDTVEAAQTLRGGFLCVDRAHAARLPAYTYFIADLIGLAVTDTEGIPSWGMRWRMTKGSPAAALRSDSALSSSRQGSSGRSNSPLSSSDSVFSQKQR